MNKFWHYALSSLLIITVWWVGLAVFASYIATNYGVAPTFPYYQLLLTETSVSKAVWGHFDGTHYLKLASIGYVDNGTQAFFPIYPLLIRLIRQTGISYFSSGRLISFACLATSLIFIYYIFGKRAWIIISVLLIFPTSFFLGAIYTESLFLMETLIFFLLIGRKQFLLAAVVAGIASGTRLVGSLLTLSFLIAIWPELKRSRYLLLLLPLCLSGLLGYMYFLNMRFADPLSFVHVQSMFGAGRSSGEVIFLPQVIYRYIKMFVTVSPSSILFWRAILEASIFGSFLYFLWKAFKSIPLSQSVYILGSLLLPTLSGTLSSIPRYALVLIPWLIPQTFRLTFRLIPFMVFSFCGLLIILAFFVQGQFVS